MKIGLSLPNFARWLRGDEIWAVCEKAKEIGFESLWFVDHMIFTPQQYVGYGNGYMDIWTAMTYVAAVTNIQGWKPLLGQQVCVIPYRPPIQQAKVAATLDSLSGGRLIIGAGTGYNEDEFAALGLNIHERGQMVDEYLKCMIELWEHPVASFHGKYVNFDEMTISVRPVQQPHPPILVGARGPGPFRRVAEYCDGWQPGALHPVGGDEMSQPAPDPDPMGRLQSNWADINKLWKEYGRKGKPILKVGGGGHLTTDRASAGETIEKGVQGEGGRTYVSRFTLTHVDDVIATARAHADIGADIWVAGFPSYRYGEFNNLGMFLNQMEIFAEHVLPKISKS